MTLSTAPFTATAGALVLTALLLSGCADPDEQGALGTPSSSSGPTPTAVPSLQPSPSPVAEPSAPTPSPTLPPALSNAEARCSDIEAIVAQWQPSDRAYFDDAGGFMRVGGNVTAGTSFEAVYIPALSETGDPYFDRFAVGPGFVTVGPFEDSRPLEDFPLQLLGESGQPVVCSAFE